MTYKDVADMIKSMGYPSAYYQFDENPENPPPAPPFICFYYPSDNDFKADDTHYKKINELIVELYTDNKDFDAETAVEAVLLSNGFVYGKAENYIESEKMFQIVYTMEVVLNA